MQMSHSLIKMQTLVISRSELAQARNHIGVVTARDVSKALLHIKHRCFRYNLASEKFYRVQAQTHYCESLRLFMI